MAQEQRRTLRRLELLEQAIVALAAVAMPDPDHMTDEQQLIALHLQELLAEIEELRVGVH